MIDNSEGDMILSRSMATPTLRDFYSMRRLAFLFIAISVGWLLVAWKLNKTLRDAPICTPPERSVVL